MRVEHPLVALADSDPEGAFRVWVLVCTEQTLRPDVGMADLAQKEVVVFFQPPWHSLATQGRCARVLWS